MPKITKESQATARKKWARALRSGKYKQDRGYLQTPRGFCCLGVLCNVLEPEGWDEDSAHFGHHEFPHPEVLRAAGISLKDAEEFAALNDDYAASFEEIAQLVERL